MATASMFQCGVSSYIAFKEGAKWIRNSIGDFEESLTGQEANKRLDHVGKIENQAQIDFIRGWDFARRSESTRYKVREKSNDRIHR